MTIRILLFPVGGPPETRDIDGSLESMQAVVGGGYIQFVPVAQGLDLVCDEEGKLNGALPNRVVPELNDVIFGPFFVSASDDEGEARSLSELELARARGLAWPTVES